MISLFMHPRAVTRFALIIISAALLASCGQGGGSHRSRDSERLDTVSFRSELDSARHLFRTGKAEEARELIGPALHASEGKPALRKQRLHALSLLGQIHQKNSQLDSALLSNEEVLLLAEATSDTFWIGAAYTNMGVVHQLQGDYAGAFDLGLLALRWKELLGDSASIARGLHNLSLLQWRRDSLDQALDFLQRSIAIKRKFDPASVHTSLNGLGVLLIEADKFDSALVVLKESLALEESVDEGAEREMQLSNIGLAFERMGQLDSAAHYYQLGLADAIEHGNHEVEIRCLYGLGDVRREQGRFREAKPLLDSSLAVAERIGSMEDMKEAHASLAALHERLHEPQHALDHFRTYHALSDSLMNAGVSGRMSEMKLRYDTERKDRENAELRAQQELAELRADRNRWIAIGIAVFAIAIIVVAWSVMQRNRQRATLREAELEQQALRLQMDPHFLFNALNTVPGLYASGDAAAANDHVGHLSSFLRLVLETSRRRTITLAQEIELVEHYLRISANRKPGSFTWEMKVMPYVQADRVAIPPMLIQPVVENAIEHGFSGGAKGHVSVLVDRAGSVLHIEVRDNGVGRASAAQRPSRRNGLSMGIDLVRKRIALFDRSTSMAEAVDVRDNTTDDGSTRGTIVTLRLRVHQMSEHAAVGDR